MSAGIKGTVSRDISGIFLCLWIGQSLIKNRSWFLNCQRTCLTAVLGRVGKNPGLFKKHPCDMKSKSPK